MPNGVSSRRLFKLILIKPSHSDDAGYVISGCARRSGEFPTALAGSGRPRAHRHLRRERPKHRAGSRNRQILRQ